MRRRRTASWKQRRPRPAPRRGTRPDMKVLVPLPDRDFDTTEVAVPWHHLRECGHEVVFATEHGDVPECDPKLLPGVIFGKLGADPEPISFYRELEQAPEFQAPITWDAIEP